ncbi:MAG: 50S ribosomal protein P1 [Candidatus Aenigmarchaeota archaeon]|nr:50S ribosomal protein P1 [Candidatus Aenigmarchaeota archaeon]
MEYMYSALLLHSAGKQVTEENVKKVVEAVGEQVNEAKVKALVAALEGVNIDEELKKASTPVAVASAPVAASGEAKKEEAKTEEDTAQKAAEAAAGLSSLFG